MFKIELKEGASVFTTDGKEVGKINRFILDPATNEVTHLVVQKGWLFSEDKVVPFNIVRSATEDKVLLNKDIENFDELPPFEERHYVEVEEEDFRAAGSPMYRNAPAYYWYPSYGYMGYPAHGLGHHSWPWPPIETRRNIPGDAVPLKEGSDVISADGEHVGDVERIFVDPESNEATHFLISQGLVFKDRKLIPAHWIRTVEEDKVHLAVTTRLLSHLPSHKP